ncbi:MAG: YifB family Mg chelatase-like AAA ATPase [Proteobacteria bacterium]|nr:YifB family Mg chelatase-like AAA ATPase [Pseudomonadota bacterium]
MELSVIYSRAMAGIQAPLVRVETHLSNGLPAFHIVGMPETAVRESKDRVRSALLNSYFEFPDRRITINLSPADLPKEGGRFDLPIALGILVASNQLPSAHLHQHEFLGELALDGTLRPIPGVIPAAREATKGKRKLVVPASCAPLAAYTPNSAIIAAEDLLTLCAHLNGSETIEPTSATSAPTPHHYPDLDVVVGQELARRALEIAASGGHNLLLFGPPGTGKTLLASRLPGILPPPTAEDALTGLALRSFYDSTDVSAWFKRPFRSPHHNATSAALIGGGGKPRPGEASLAHGGVLFLDELPEFSRNALEVLREPMESGEVTISRANHKITYPARFQLVAAMNPCPCGYDGDPEQNCRCTQSQIQRYRQRISGPLLDRIDLTIAMTRIPPSTLLNSTGLSENSTSVKARVVQANALQTQRQGCANALLAGADLTKYCELGAAQKRFLQTAMDNIKLSARGLHRTLRVSRTIADLEGTSTLTTEHISEALAYRNPGLKQ